MPTSAGGSGSAAIRRVSVSESCIDPPQGLLAVERGELRPELATVLGAGERAAQRPQVAADGLQLAQERARRWRVERLRGAGAQLPEALQRQGRHGCRLGGHGENLLGLVHAEAEYGRRPERRTWRELRRREAGLIRRVG